jgi:hypothetical protein
MRAPRFARAAFKSAPHANAAMAPPVPVETGFEGGHGSHWDAVIEDPGELAGIVSKVYKHGNVAERFLRKLPQGEAAVRLLCLPMGGPAFETRLFEVSMGPKEKPGVATIYPHLAQAGAPIEMRPTRVIEWGHGAFEAEVAARIVGNGSEVVFFATDYHANRAAYRSGETQAVALSAVAYTCGVISPAARVERVGEAEVDVSKATIVAPLKDSERAPYYDDDFFLQGPVMSCAPFAYPPWGEGAVIELDLDLVGRLPVFTRKKDFPHGWPRQGEFLAAYSWLQGRASKA